MRNGRHHLPTCHFNFILTVNFVRIQGKHNPRATDPPIDTSKNPNFLVLVSENFIEARAAFSRSGMTNLVSNHSPVKMDVSSVLPVSGPQSISISAGLCNFFELISNYVSIDSWTVCLYSIV